MRQPGTHGDKASRRPAARGADSGYGAAERPMRGGIPQADRAELLELGVAGVFGPGASMADIVAWVRENVPEREVG